MKLNIPFASALALCAAAPALQAADATLQAQLRDALDYAVTKEDALVSILGNNGEKFVDYSNSAGTWNIKNDSTWCSGFLPGIFWDLYTYTGDDTWRTRAEKWTEGTRSRATATDNDTGFQVFESFGYGLAATGDLHKTDYTNVLLTGAQTLVDERWNAGIGAFRAWGSGGSANVSNPTDLPFEVNTDMIMNMELILWAGQNGGPTSYVDDAVQHADTMWDNDVRSDGSTWHVVAFNLDGTIDYRRTAQGWKTDSTWSRGQAWAVYGYTMVYRYTQLPRMLDHAKAVYDYFMQATAAQTNDHIPYSDFDAPLDSKNPRDSSAAAIVCSAALDLYTITGEQRYLNDAEDILRTLSQPPYLTTGTSYQSVLKKASERWGGGEEAAIFADRYFIQAALKYLALPAGTDELPADSPWRDQGTVNGYYVATGNYLGTLYVRDAPWVYSFALNTWLYIDDAWLQSGGTWAYVLKR